jgi:O-antigen/teichoic acid export membrane protein
MFTFGYAFFLQGTTFVIGIKLGSVQVATFNTIRTLINSVKAFSTVIYLPYLTDFTILVANGKVEIVKQKFQSLIRYVGIFAITAALTIYLFRSSIFMYWIGRTLNYPNLFFVLMLGSIIFQSVWNAASMLPLSVAKNRIFILFPLFAAVNVFLQILLIEMFGLTFVGALLFLLDVAMFLYVYLICTKIINGFFRPSYVEKK